MLLPDVGAKDKDGIPIKESHKAKMNLFAHGEEDVKTLIGLSSEVPSREQDEDGIAAMF
jgi:hypothetical protein